MVLIVVWELTYRIEVEYFKLWQAYSFPSPIPVIKSMILLVNDNTLALALLMSMRRVLIGYTLSVVIGIICGLALVRYRFIDESLGPIILGFQTLPNICWVPFAILWYGLNEKAIIFIIIAGSTFSITLAIQTGIKNINPIYIKAAKTMGAKNLSLYWNVVFPAVMPGLISGMKQGWSFAWRALMAGEMFCASIGLGQLLMTAREFFDIGLLVAIMIIIIVIGLAIDKYVFAKIEARIRHKRGLSIL